MGQKDLREKLLEDYDDVFSDIFNGLLFKEHVIKEEYLQDGGTESIYKADNQNYRGQYRDILKEYRNNCNGCILEIGSLGIENQTAYDKYISVRVMGYDYAKYRIQIDKEKYPLLPVITIVLNFSDKRWKDTKNLHSIMSIPDQFKPYTQDYEVNVYDIAFLDDDIINGFHSDFKLVAKFFKNKRLGITDLSRENKIRHVEAFIDFLSVFTNDDRYKEISMKLNTIKQKGDDITMCTIAQALEEKGIEKGIEKGKAENFVSNVNNLISNMHLTLDAACQALGSSVQEYENFKKLLQ